MTSVTVWESVNQHKLVMKTHRHLILLEYMVFDLEASVLQQVTQFHGNLSPFNTDVFVGLTERSGPLPSPIEHLAMQISHKALIQ